MSRVAVILDYPNSGNLQVSYEATWALAHDPDDAEYLWKNVANIGGYAQLGYHCQRACLILDTSILTGRTLLSARLCGTIDAASKSEADPGYAQLNIVEGAFSIPLAFSDYGQLRDKTVSGGALNYSDASSLLNSPSRIALNDVGLGWINPSGATKLGLRVFADINDLAPTGSNTLVFDSDSPVRTLKPVTSGASSVKSRRAVLNGIYRGLGYPELDIEYSGVDIDYPYVCFVWGEGVSYDHLTSPRRDVAVGDPFSEVITGLKPDTLYSYKARVYTAGSSYREGSAVSFTTEKGYLGNINIDQLIYQHAERMEV